MMNAQSMFSTGSVPQGIGRGLSLLIIVTLAFALLTRPAKAQTYTVLHSLAGGTTDGLMPDAGLIRDSAGNLYGTTQGGGFSQAGTVFKIDSTGNESVLYNFTGGADGNRPYAGVIRDGSGNFYGTTEFGGSATFGVVFKLDTMGNETILHTFIGGADGKNPVAGLIRDSYGNLYGTTEYGGVYSRGIVFKLSPTGKETVLHSFAGGTTDGIYPYSSLIRDSSGNLYGTTEYGGASGVGTVFKLDLTGHETILHSFTGRDGAHPLASLIRDGYGNLYGTTEFGGASSSGVIFKIDATTNLEHVLHAFIGGADGADPYGNLIRDSSGNLYGTTYAGGPNGQGVVFKLSATNTETILHYFTGAPDDGANPAAGLIRDSAGNLYSTTVRGSVGSYDNYGIVFRLLP